MRLITTTFFEKAHQPFISLFQQKFVNHQLQGARICAIGSIVAMAVLSVEDHVIAFWFKSRQNSFITRRRHFYN